MKEQIIEFAPYQVPLDSRLQSHIYALCKITNIDFPFILATIKSMSDFRSEVPGGLMHISTSIQAWVESKYQIKTTPENSYDNTLCGILYLEHLLKNNASPKTAIRLYALQNGLINPHEYEKELKLCRLYEIMMFYTIEIVTNAELEYS